LLSLFFCLGVVSGTPSINNALGTFEHGETFSIIGNEFGIKNPAEPVWWDDGEEAVNIYKNRHSEIKAVLLDLVMPKKGGKETFLEMKQINTLLKVILTSGFKGDERVKEILQYGAIDFLPKPYTFSSLVKIFRENIEKVLHE